MELADQFGRVHKDLRISLTDRCNFRCSYCMPEEGLDWLDNSEYLTFEEIDRTVALMVQNFGITSIRLTGGEPTLRKDLPDLIKTLSKYEVDLAMTTNAATLARNAKSYKEAGLQRLNISLDTLDKTKFLELTKRDRYQEVLSGIEEAKQLGFIIKINVVLMRGVNDSEILDFLEFGRKNNITVRFIEFMPIDAQQEWETTQVFSSDEILEVASKEYEFTEIASGSSPATNYRYSNSDLEFGIIPSVTKSFCSTCDRVRLTADGQIRNCLFANKYLDIKQLLRNGSTDNELMKAIQVEIKDKWAGHSIGQVHFIKPSKSMSQVGG